jgi:ribosomal protein S18 acetylase RimI-like enzyme
LPTIREMRDADIGRCFEIRAQTRENGVSRAELELAGITERSVADKLATTHRGWVCERDGEVVGFSIADRSNGELWVVAVLPGHEGRGVGTALVELAQRWLHDLGWAEVWLWTSAETPTRAYKLYRRLGWQDCGVRDGRLTMRHTETSGVAGAG